LSVTFSVEVLGNFGYDPWSARDFLLVLLKQSQPVFSRWKIATRNAPMGSQTGQGASIHTWKDTFSATADGLSKWQLRALPPTEL
jgi:hypothetical protein